MIKEKLADALNEQINKELYSAYLYMALSSSAMQSGMKGVANWFRIQAQEEMTHAMKFYDYVTSQGAHVVMKAVEAPPSAFDGVVAMFEKTLEHERHITASIAELVELARAERDYATEIMLQWFITEQVEEEEGVSEILDQLKLAGSSGGGLFMIDRELGTRVFVPPAAST